MIPNSGGVDVSLSPIVTGKTLQHQKGLMGCADLLSSSTLLALRPLDGLFRNLGMVGVIEWLASLTTWLVQTTCALYLLLDLKQQIKDHIASFSSSRLNLKWLRYSHGIL